MTRFIIGCLVIFAIIHGEKMLVSSKEANVYWRDYRGTIPRDAVPTGHGVYIAQVPVSNGGSVPGTFYPNRRLVITEVETRKVELNTNIKILCSPSPSELKWEYVNANQLNKEKLEDCVPGGFEIGYPLYIGKIFHEGEWKIGKVFPAHSPYNGLRIWWNGGGGYFPSDFQILMVA